MLAVNTVFYLPRRELIPTVCQTSWYPIRETWGGLGLTQMKFSVSGIFQLLLPQGRAVCDNV